MNEVFLGIIQYTILGIVNEKNTGFGKNKPSLYPYLMCCAANKSNPAHKLPRIWDAESKVNVHFVD